MKSTPIRLLIILSVFIFVIQLFSCKKSTKSAYPVFKDKSLGQINTQLIRFDSMIYRNEIESFMENACPVVEKIIAKLTLRSDTSTIYYLLAKAYRIRGACGEWGGEFDQALSDYERAENIFNRYRQKNSFDAREEADLLNYLGVYYQNVSYDPTLSNRYLERSNDLNKTIDRPIELVRNWCNLANSALISNKLKDAEYSLNLAMEEYFRIPNRKDFLIDYYGILNFQGILYKSMADSLSLLGQNDAAKTKCDLSLGKYKKVLDGLEQMKDPTLLQRHLAVYLNCMALLQRHIDFYPHGADSIRQYLSEALDLIPLDLRNVYVQKLSYPLAFVLAREGNEKAGVDTIERAHLRNLAQGYYEKALVNPTLLDNAFNVLKTRVRVLGMLAQKSQNPKDWLNAIKACQDNLQRVIDIRERLVADASQESIPLEFHSATQYGLDYVYQYWKLTKKEANLDPGIELLSSSKALILEQQLQKTRLFDYRNTSSKAHPAFTEYTLQKTIQRQSQLGDQEALEKVRQQYRIYTDTLKNSHQVLSQRYYLERFAKTPLSVSKVRQLLPNGQTAIVDYQTIINHAYAMVITAKTAQLIPLPIDRNFFTTVEAYRKYLKSNSNKIHQVSHQLHQYLVAPLDSLLLTQQIKELIVLPDQNTANIPFESMVVKHQAKRNIYLLEKYDISYHYSLSAWLVQQQIEQQKAKPKEKLGCFVAVPQKDGQFAEACAALALPKLVNVSQKIAGKSGQKNYYPATNRNTFLKDCKKYDILQLTLHGCVDEQNNKQPYLVFAPGQSAKDRLWMQDIYDLSLNARLVVLGSCFTAQGEANSSEGAKSIARAFLFGGCPRVIAGINSVPDEAGATILTYFYENLFDKMPPVQALSAAKKKYVLNQKNPHPSLWASLVLFGDPSWQ